MCGSSSLSQAPDLPCCANLYFDGTTGKFACVADMAVRRWPLRTDSGKSTPWWSDQARLVVEEIDLRRAAGLKQVDDALRCRRNMGRGRQASDAGEGAGREQRSERGGAYAGRSES